MTYPAPVDPTKTAAWKALSAHFSQLQADGVDLRTWFTQDANRVEKMTFDVEDLRFDFSKNLATPQTLQLLCDLADEVRLKARLDDMLAGVHINTSENRAVLHAALRRPKAAEALIVDEQNTTKAVHDVLAHMFNFAEKVRSGEWTGASGKPIKTVVNIGIGGSDLGPAMCYEALRAYADAGISARFVSNVDPNDLAEKTHDLDPETTLFIVVSKTFTTLETLTNAKEAKRWLLEGLEKRGIISQGANDAVAYAETAAHNDTASRNNAASHSDVDAHNDAALRNGLTPQKEAIAKHFVAVSTQKELVSAFGIDPENTFGFWDWVGGRYSVDSAVGLVLAVVFGPERFEEFLAGMHAIDDYVSSTPFNQNAVILMGLLNIWYVNFFHFTSHAVLPYDQYLSRFPAYLQQLTMESNGKSVRWDGTPVTCHTGEVFWGEPGTNGQHAFFQLLHQGTEIVPADFIAFVNTPNPMVVDAQDVQELLLGNFLAQTKALAFGKTPDEVRAEGVEESLVSARSFSGNRPSTSIFGIALTPFSLGELIAVYEYITFVEGTVWGINSFDQWGVELGKAMAKQITPALSESDNALAKEDASTKHLIEFYRTYRDNLD